MRLVIEEIFRFNNMYFRPDFVNTYFKIIDSAAHKDREGVLKFSRELGFLTGD